VFFIFGGLFAVDFSSEGWVSRRFRGTSKISNQTRAASFPAVFPDRGKRFDAQKAPSNQHVSQYAR
jgi:hypothetical protein